MVDTVTRPALPTLALAALFLTTQGCTTFEGHKALVPFYEVYEDPEDIPPLRTAATRVEPEAVKPLSPPPRAVERPPGKEVVIRPFGSYASFGQDYWRFRALWPLAESRRIDGEERDYIFPFWYRKKSRGLQGGPNNRWMFFPILFGGEIYREGKYFAVFPFGGKLRRLLGKEEIDFILFPLYWKNLAAGNYSVHILFPFYNRMWGEETHGWRIWPFYGRYRSVTRDGRPRYDRRFWMWPFYIYQENDLNTRRPSKLIFIFPFYGKSESNRTLTRTILWPFFHTTINKKTGEKIHFGYVVPYRFGGGYFDVWPFFGVKSEKQTDKMEAGEPYTRYRQFCLWPIQRYNREEDDNRISTRFWIMPFYWRFWSIRKADQAEDLEWRIWPLVRYRRVRDYRDFFILSLNPLRQEVPLERFYARFWRIVLFRDTPRWTGWEALFTLLSYRDQKKEDTRTFSVLGGLFGRKETPQGKQYRFFYLPWR